MRGVFNSRIPTTMYSGGNGLGASQQSIFQNNCPPEQLQTIYYGGLGYGNQQEVIVQNICVAPPIETIFYGGLGYGNQQEVIVQNVCLAPPIQTIFYGGTGFGDEQKIIIQSVCIAPSIESIFYGGNGFGNQNQKVIQTDCSVDLSIPTVTSAGGRIWMDRNLGSTQVATSVTDNAAYGDLYQWGRTTDGHQLRTSGNTSTQSTTNTPGNNLFIVGSTDWRNTSNANLWQGNPGTNNPCPNGFRLPTSAEWDIETASWISQNEVGAFASPLKLTSAGFRLFSDGVINNDGIWADYWSSTGDGTSNYRMYFHQWGVGKDLQSRGFGFSCRCIKN